MRNNATKTIVNVSKKIILSLSIPVFAFMANPFNVSAQAYSLKQVIVLNQGPYAAAPHVTVGSYNPVTKVYTNFDTIKNARFASDVIIDSGYIYVAADTLLVKYDLNTHARLATQTIIGIREVAVWGNQILVTCGTTFALKAYFKAYNKNNLSFIYQDTTVSHATEGIKVLHDTAYIAINDFGSGLIGKLGVVDLKAQKERREIDLGVNGLNPFNVEVDKTGQKIYTVNDLNFNNASVTKYDAPTATFSNTMLNLTTGCSGSTFYLSNVYFQASNENNIRAFSTNSLSVWDSLKIKKDLYGIGVDSANGLLYVGITDYVSYGKVYVYNLFGAVQDSFAVNVSPGNFAFDVRRVTGFDEVNNLSGQLNVYPNPANTEVHVNYWGAMGQKATMSLYNIMGQMVFSEQINTNSVNNISLNGLASGVYTLRVESASGIAVKRIVKQ